MSRKICMSISPKGVLKVWPEGVTGPECTEFTKKFREGLGLVDAEREIKPEMYQTTENQQEQST